MRSALSSEGEGGAAAASETAASRSSGSLVIALVSSPPARHSASGGCQGQATGQYRPPEVVETSQVVTISPRRPRGPRDVSAGQRPGLIPAARSSAGPPSAGPHPGSSPGPDPPGFPLGTDGDGRTWIGGD